MILRLAPLFLSIFLIFSFAGCAPKKIDTPKEATKVLSRCEKLKLEVKKANKQVKRIEKEAKEKIGDKFKYTERSLIPYPELEHAYTNALDNLALAVQDYKSAHCE